MGRLKLPLLSLDAKGTIGKALTYQGRGQDTIVRTKPIPAYRRTLPQVYQRWLYEDYAYLWTQQSIATKQTYATAGSRHHLTGFQYWMKYHLTNLPDILGMWYLDEKSGAIAYDASRNANHAIIIGATPVDGTIDGAFSFDGLNDYLNCGHDPSLDITGHFSIELFISTDTAWASQNDWRTIIFKEDATDGYAIYIVHNQNKLQGSILLAGVRKTVTTDFNLTTDTLYHLVLNYDQVNLVQHTNGVPHGTTPTNQAVGVCTTDLYIARRGGYWTDVVIDHLIIRNRDLDQSEILRHSLRRYP